MTFDDMDWFMRAVCSLSIWMWTVIYWRLLICADEVALEKLRQARKEEFDFWQSIRLYHHVSANDGWPSYGKEEV